MTKISVIIPTYNSSKYLSRAIESVLCQTFKTFEIIVVDDGSTDNTKNVLESYIKKGAIRYFYQKNAGPSAARNQGIKMAKGKYVAFLDSDDIWLPSKLELQMDIISVNDSIGLVTCGRYLMDKYGEVLESFPGLKHINKHKLMNEFLIRNVIAGGGSSVLIRKECFDKLGLFDETLVVAEDWDMWLRICKSYEFESCNIPLIKILIHEGSQSYFGQINLINELQFIDKIFSEDGMRNNWFLKRKSYSYRYYSAAIAYKEAKKRKETARCCLKAFLLFPVHFLKKQFIGILLWVMLGDSLFVKLKKIRRV